VQVRRLVISASLIAGAALIAATVPGIALATPPPAPKPTSTDISPAAPDPHPPLGGKAPDGSVLGGQRLASRGIVTPPGTPALPKQITAASWVLADLDSGEILAARDPHGRYQPASILKTLTAITLLPNLPGNRVITVSQAAAHAEGSAVGLLAGGKYTVDQLFSALVLVSGNDAAAALAEANGGVAKTVAEMNAKAESLGAYDTFVQTPSGLDGWQQLTSAYDMALVLRAALHEPRFIAYDRITSATYPPQTSTYGHVDTFQFTNQMQNFLDSVPGALVAKTGFTDAARHTYLCAAERNGRRLGVVLLRNERIPLDQFQQASALFKWGFALKPTTPGVGTLAGPISQAAPLVTPPPGAASSSQPAHATSTASTLQQNAEAGRSAPTIAWVARVLALGLGAVAARRLQLRRRRLRR
jgi:serine-type D-Ala-D-Ala carboxypeptidase (penicillin-binding protein 5/6)